jgi:hypothetical protein
MMELTAEHFTTGTIFHLSFDICHWSIQFDDQLNAEDAEVFAEGAECFKDEG